MSLPTLPKVALRYCVGVTNTGETMDYTMAQMQAYGQQCRSEALEEAAQVCDERANGENDAQYCADRIRRLK